jgi:hypothetical protein
VEQVAPIAARKVPKQAELLPVPPFAVVRQQGGASGGRSGRPSDDGNPGEADSSGPGSVAAATEGHDEAERTGAPDNSGPGKPEENRAEVDRHDNSGPGSGVDLNEPEPELAAPTDGHAEQPEAESGNSGPGSRGDNSGDGGRADEPDG